MLSLSRMLLEIIDLYLRNVEELVKVKIVMD
jgi:hypothetical protein